ncbi:beta-glucoside-specific PTS transporter subunit IIABC [Streptococcus macacae]|uniref:PTS system sucrose-specific EIIBCA component n=1 Tax=Streptococcus macacae NCTC 11558 TaxID=764298 RepID=G5JUP7_9STRE|nr:beta-glucoside-specific PTS transporter subunit IIABC [Streptococcus macacae]EHJ52025.1 PTS system, beta-glucoside-specific, IIABC component [Streptococcus macacae NCTC 11558]SUN78862.1 PTS system beta-glucosides-specific transporter subunit IIABC [Streptococcus macacae NCTC 11558]
MENKELAQKIIDLVAGEKNIATITHCATRLRFNLKDDSKADAEVLKNLPGVLTAQFSSGQLQVVIGAKVQAIYKEVINLVNVKEESDEAPKTRFSLSAIVETISGVFSPTLPVLVGCGMLKAIVSLLTNLHIIGADDSLTILLSMMGNLIFYFFPFFLAVSAAKKFKVSEYMALALAAAYMYPTIMEGAAKIAEGGPSALTVLGLPILFVNYSSTVIPIILSVWILSLIYNKIDKLVPDFLKILFSSMLVLLVMVPLQLVVLGPIGSYAGTYIAQAIEWFYTFGGVFSAALLGGTRSILTMLGMHYALAPLQIQQIAETGASTLLVSALTANFAQAGAALGTGVALKDKTEKSVAFSTAFTALLGITEPAMYGVNLKYKRPFAIALASSAVAAAFLSLFNTGAMVYAPPGLFTLITYKADSFVFVLIGVAVAFFMAAILSYFFGLTGKSLSTPAAEEDKKLVSEDILAPLAGQVLPLSQVKDEVFASGAMGTGLAILPNEGKLYAPFDGKVSMIFKTQHALGLVSDELGIELLIHIGMNTVEENGSGFHALVKEGDHFKAGQVLLEFDLETLSQKYPMETPIIVTNNSAFSNIQTYDQQTVTQKDVIMMLEGEKSSN